MSLSKVLKGRAAFVYPYDNEIYIYSFIPASFPYENLQAFIMQSQWNLLVVTEAETEEQNSD